MSGIGGRKDGKGIAIEWKCRIRDRREKTFAIHERSQQQVEMKFSRPD